MTEIQWTQLPAGWVAQASGCTLIVNPPLKAKEAWYWEVCQQTEQLSGRVTTEAGRAWSERAAKACAGHIAERLANGTL